MKLWNIIVQDGDWAMHDINISTNADNMIQSLQELFNLMATQFTSGEQERIARMIKRNIVSHPDFNGSIPENRYVVKEVPSENRRLLHITRQS